MALKARDMRRALMPGWLSDMLPLPCLGVSWHSVQFLFIPKSPKHLLFLHVYGHVLGSLNCHILRDNSSSGNYLSIFFPFSSVATCATSSARSFRKWRKQSGPLAVRLANKCVTKTRKGPWRLVDSTAEMLWHLHTNAMVMPTILYYTILYLEWNCQRAIKVGQGASQCKLKLATRMTAR